MTKPTKRLGRGLDSLVSDLSAGGRNVTSDEGVGAHRDLTSIEQRAAEGGGPTMLPTDSLSPNPSQPRSIMNDESVASLAASIARRGLLQPIVVRSVAGHYQIIAGERRWRAAQSLGMTRIPVVVREAKDDEMLELALIENIQREDLNAIDRAGAYREFCTRLSVSPEEVAKRLGEDRTTVVNYLRLLDLPESIQAFVAAGRLSMGHARCLLGVADAVHRVRLAESVIENEISVRALEEIVRREKTRSEGERTASGTKERARSAHVLDVQRRFEEALKTKVTIHEGRRKGAGRVVIEYFSLDDFERIAATLGVRLE